MATSVIEQARIQAQVLVPLVRSSIVGVVAPGCWAIISCGAVRASASVAKKQQMRLLMGRGVWRFGPEIRGLFIAKR